MDIRKFFKDHIIDNLNFLVFEYDINTAIRKIESLELEKEKIEANIGYARMIKMTGHIPRIPNDIKREKPKEYTEKGLEKWNINNDKSLQAIYKLMSLYTTEEKTNIPEDLDEIMDNLLALLENLQANPELMLIGHFYEEIAKRKNEDYKNAEVQLLVKMIYDIFKSNANRENRELILNCF